jgi:peptide/nickel transport system permease protein
MADHDELAPRRESESHSMHRYVVSRLVSTLFTLVGISILIFLLVRMIPGTIIDAILGQGAQRTPELLRDMRAFFGLDVPLYVQYFRWMGDVLSGSLGISWRASMPVLDLLMDRFPVTLELSILAMLVTVLVGIPAGLLSAVYKDSFLDNAGRVVSFISLGLPNFWQGAMAILILSKFFHWIPPMQFVSLFKDPATNLKMLALPAVVLGTVNIANVMRLTRAAMLEILSQDYVRTARAKGLRENLVVLRHAFPNCLITVVTIVGLMTGYLLGGAVTVEAVFVLPGLGRLILMSIFQRDYPVIQGALLFTCGLFVLINFLIDVMYAWMDPRLRHA